MKISHRLISGHIVIVLLVLAVGLFGLFSSERIVDSFENKEKHFRSIITSATEISSYAKRAEGHMILFLTLHDKEDREKFFARYDSLLEEVKILDRVVKDSWARKLVEDIKDKTGELLPVGEKLLKVYDRDMFSSDSFNLKKYKPDVKKFFDITSGIRQLGVNLAIREAVLNEEVHRSAIKKATVLQSYSSAIILVAVIIALIQAYVFSRKIGRPISQLKEKADEVGSGNLDTVIEINSKDEIGDLAASFNKMIEDLRTSRYEIISERQRLLVTLRSIGDGVITTDTHGNVVLINKIAEALTGWTQEEAFGRHLREVFNIINEKTRKLCENPVEKVMRTGQIVDLANHTALISRDGTERIIADSGAPIVNDEGVVIGVVLVFRDITEKQRIEDEIIKAQKIESLGVLAGGIAHDFNNILVGILGNISLAKRKLEIEDKEKLMGRLTGVENAALRAKDLSHQLLTFSKGGAPIMKTTSISELIMDSTKFVMAGSNLICQFSFPDGLWLVDVDRGQLSQVIHNLTMNAKWAMPEGGIIKIGAENIILGEGRGSGIPLPEGRYVKISVKDEGIGIPAENLKKIFDPYFTTKEMGTGIGLTTVYSIIKRHDGLITAESTEGEGTTFYIYLPASEKEASAEAGDYKVLSGKGKILLMDDDEIVRDTTGNMLIELGYEVAMAEDGMSAIKLYKEARASNQSFDTAILDLTIPGGMGGKDTIQELLKIDPNVKAIVSSGYSEDPVMAEFEKYGFMAVIKKPYNIQEISALLHKIVG